LGLAIVQELMQRHGGSVSLSSKIGAGSIFTLRFPLFEAEPPFEEALEESQAGLKGS
jgi:signal transduction histidine kinase